MFIISADRPFKYLQTSIKKNSMHFWRTDFLFEFSKSQIPNCSFLVYGADTAHVYCLFCEGYVLYKTSISTDSR